MTRTVEHDVLEPVPPIDRAVFGDVWSLPDDPALRLELVRGAVQLHLAKCPKYNGFAARTEFSIDSLREPADLHLVPQIPTLAFKLGDPIRSCDPQDVAKRCTSSGTLGRRSEVYRDRSTIERLLGSVRAGIALIGDWQDDEVGVLNLGPGQREAGDLWFAYVMSLVELLYPTVHAVRAGRFDLEGALATLESLRERHPTVVLIGPPALVGELARAAGSALRSALPSSELFVVTAGGWKRSSGAVLDRDEFSATLLRDLGLEDAFRIRDAFNQVELNTVMLECGAQRKHIPPWLEVIVRDPYTLQPLQPGDQGLISYLDPSATSYPCFILGEDIGTVDNGPCPCGWHGRTLTHGRRVEREEQWGCALKMERDYTTEGHR